MRIHKTGHQIADTVADAFIKGGYNANADLAYGILRGTADIFKKSNNWFCIDNGFWGAGHYSGQYRINFKGTQSAYSCELQKPHGLALEDWSLGGDTILIVPPSDYVCEFFAINGLDWLCEISRNCYPDKFIVRHKLDKSPINWNKTKGVITFNSTLGVEALRRGIPVISDTQHSMIGSYYKQQLIEKGLDYNFDNVITVTRDSLLNCMRYHQFTLEEIREGKAWSLINHYLSL